MHCIYIVVSWIAWRMKNDETPMKRRRALMLSGLERYYAICGRAGRFLSESEVLDCRAAIHQHVLNYAYLAFHSMQLGLKMYNIVNKHHYMVHVALALAAKSFVVAVL